MGTNYGRGMYKQLTEQTEKSERLEGENRVLRVENKQLRAKVVTLENKLETWEARMQTQIEEAVGKAVCKAVVPLQQEIKRKDAEIDRLRVVINKDSGNSSKPPSSDGFKKIPNLREPSGRKSGGQKGHAGHRLALPSELDRLVTEGKIDYRQADNGDQDEGKEPILRWVIDLETKVVVTEYQYASTSQIPESQRNEVSYGQGIKALAVHLTMEEMVSMERLAQFIEDISGGIIRPSSRLNGLRWRSPVISSKVSINMNLLCFVESLYSYLCRLLFKYLWLFPKTAREHSRAYARI